MKPRKPVKLKQIIMPTYAPGFTVAEWSILSGHSVRMVGYQVKRGDWKRPDGKPGAHKRGRDWFILPDAILVPPKRKGGPGRPPGGKNKPGHGAGRPKRKLGYPRARKINRKG